MLSVRVQKVHLEGDRLSSAKESRSEHQSSSAPKHPHRRRRNYRRTIAYGFHLLHRLVIFSAAIVYVVIALTGAMASINVLLIKRTEDSLLDYVPYQSLLILSTVENASSIQTSKLFTEYLQNDSTPRDYTLYMDQGGEYRNNTGCSIPHLIDTMYSDTFLRHVYSTMVQDTSYNLTFFNDLELVVPVVDCEADALMYEDNTVWTFFYLVRTKAAPHVVSLLVMKTCNQAYAVVNHDETGPASVATVVLINDLKATKLDHYFILSLGFPFEQLQYQAYQYVDTTDEHYWILQSIPVDPRLQVPKTIMTATKSGFYLQSESEQSNIGIDFWRLDDDPLEVIRVYQWIGGAVLRDSWAWVHCIHIFLASYVVFHLVVLVMVFSRNWQTGIYWIGDSFVAISTSLLLRGFLVLVSWYINKFWSLYEFALHDANAVNTTPPMFIRHEIMRADLITIYLSVVGFMGKLLHERIDPAVAVYAFLAGFNYRADIITWFPAMHEHMQHVAYVDYTANIGESTEAMRLVSPMTQWAPHVMVEIPPSFIVTALFPIFSTLIPIFAYACARKLFRRLKRTYGDDQTRRYRAQVHAAAVDMSEGHGEDRDDDDPKTMVPNSVTQFEAATGARLERQFGLLSDYENYRYIKGLTYASADGIYSNGYVIANGKFLVQTEDLGTIVLMKLLRLRFRNVYVYDVHNFKVDAMARLVYPETMTWTDLFLLNISILS